MAVAASLTRLNGLPAGPPLWPENRSRYPEPDWSSIGIVSLMQSRAIGGRPHLSPAERYVLCRLICENEMSRGGLVVNRRRARQEVAPNPDLALESQTPIEPRRWRAVR